MSRFRLAALALAAGAAFLQGCATSQPTGDEASLAVARPQASAAQPARGTASPGQGAVRPQGAAAPLAAPARDGFAPAAVTIPPPPRIAAPGRSPRSARDLAGMTDGQLLSVMGEPDLKRREDGAEAWLYRSPACLLDVFLEAEAPGAEPRVVLATARPLAAQMPEEACLRGLARARAGLRQPFQP